MSAVVMRQKGSRPTSERAFTLVELLVVVAIILVLVGITLKVAGLATEKSAKMKTNHIIEQVKNALAEYYTLNGTYPPGDKAAYGHSPVEYVTPPGTIRSKYPTCPDWESSTGLVYYLAYSQGADRWSQYTKGVVPNSWYGIIVDDLTFQGGQAIPAFTNNIESIHDAWDHELHYTSSSTNGYQSYRLWSDGPSSSTNDDIGTTGAE